VVYPCAGHSVQLFDNLVVIALYYFMLWSDKLNKINMYTTYKECPENVVRNAKRTVAVIVAEADDTVSFIRAEWEEH